MKKTNLQNEKNDKNFTEKSQRSHLTAINYQQNTRTGRMITMKTTSMITRQDKNTEKKERVIAMKRVNIIVLAIGILIGAALCALLLKDGDITIWEAAAGFAYLAALRVTAMLLKRGRKKTAPRRKTFRSLIPAPAATRTGAYAIRSRTI